MKSKRILGISIGFSLVILITRTVIFFGMSRLTQMQAAAGRQDHAG
ncbi:MAG: hypothetical protein OEY67_00135 [Gammaproteobacteria bacterium]|nr:hypothetical protein [Gammaproteobacteria bacterium]